MTSSLSPRSGNITGAILWMLGSLTSFSMIAIAGREASRVITTTELMFWRGLIGLAILVVILATFGGRLAEVRSGQPKLQVARSVIHFGAQFSWLYCLTLIPLVELFALEFTAPLWVAVLAPLFLGEKLTATRIAAAGLGFIGAMIVIQPGSTSLSLGSALALASAVGFACNMLATKQLTKTDKPFTILLWMNGLQAIIGLGFMSRGFTWPDPMTWFYTAIVALGGLTAHYSLSRAFALADAIIVAPMDFLRLPLIAVVGAWIYGETLADKVLIGALCIVAGNAINLLAERRR
jgi:drug/metabolite transporter (DMT)-like permease